MLPVSEKSLPAKEYGLEGGWFSRRRFKAISNCGVLTLSAWNVRHLGTQDVYSLDWETAK